MSHDFFIIAAYGAALLILVPLGLVSWRRARTLEKKAGQIKSRRGEPS